ncbi:hypothetical protein [Methylomarinum vadi]|uniref:hypothetical protein n=1 Tax=Methylomarinum vadi TaxID=438855 RepID=UPI0012684494|nr:hypothetical protein [Methylomarinum vadi]
MLYKTYAEAYEASQQLKHQYAADGIMVKIEKSPYGGFRLKLVPIDLMIDNLSGTTQNGKSRGTAICF